jgi:hypothetical protein
MDNIVFPMPDMFDLDAISEIAYRNLEGNTHRRLADDEPYMAQLREQYPWLSKSYHVYKPKKQMQLHVDSNRTCAINIPVRCDNSETIVYEWINERFGDYDEKRKLYNISESDVREVHRFTLTEPVLFNTTMPHKVEVTGSDRRISISWNVNGTFEEIKNKYIHANR